MLQICLSSLSISRILSVPGKSADVPRAKRKTFPFRLELFFCWTLLCRFWDDWPTFCSDAVSIGVVEQMNGLFCFLFRNWAVIFKKFESLKNYGSASAASHFMFVLGMGQDPTLVTRAADKDTTSIELCPAGSKNSVFVPAEEEKEKLCRRICGEKTGNKRLHLWHSTCKKFATHPLAGKVLRRKT